MQPLDVPFMFWFKTFYGKADENWLFNHTNRIVNKLQIAGLVNIAYSELASMSNAVSGFRKTGILPFDPSVFKDEDFLAHRQEREAEARRKYGSSWNRGPDLNPSNPISATVPPELVTSSMFNPAPNPVTTLEQTVAVVV